MPPYSTLEVQQAEVYDDSGTTKEAVVHPQTLYPQLASLESYEPGANFPEVASHEGRYDPYDDPSPSQGKQASKRCGLPTRMFNIVLVVGVLVIIGAIAGGVAGGLLSRHGETAHEGSEYPSYNPSYDPNSRNGSATQTNINILSISKLSSSNRTDSMGNIHRTVFFQDTHNALMARRWDSQNRTWFTSNITEITSGSIARIVPSPGTPLASASCSYGTVTEVHLWFLVQDSYVASFWVENPDSSPDGWEYDSFGGASFQTSTGSQLAAMWQRCWPGPCAGYWIFAYQTPQGDINVANASNWHNPTTVVTSREVADNSSIGIVPQLEKEQQKYIGRVVLATESLNSGTIGTMQKMEYESMWSPGRSSHRLG